jgi:glycine reductase
MYRYPVRSVEWGEATRYNAGRLIVNRDHLLEYLQSKKLLNDLEITDMALVSPDTPTRIVNIFDVFAARTRLGKGAVDYPGVLGPQQSVGDGVSATLDNFTVMTTTGKISRFYNKLLDVSGFGSAITPYACMFHLALSVMPKQADMPQPAYFVGLKRIGLCVGSYLAQAAAEAAPEHTDTFTLEPRPQGLPRAAYVCMLSSHQKSEVGEPVLYGDDVSGLLPTILHPNEFLDGAVGTQYWSFAIDTYSQQNNPVILGLYEKHGKEVDFAGVVVCVAHITRERRERSVQMIANLVHTVLGADIAIVSKVGGGIPESDLMMSIEALEKRGVCTSAVIMSHMGDGTIQDSQSVYYAAADAVASAGIQDTWVDLPEQKEAFGGSTIGPFSSVPGSKPVPANAAVRLDYRDVAGAISQIGANYVKMVEI